MLTLDLIDQRIVAVLRASARISLTDLAREIGRSRTAVQARVERLERTGVIRGYHAVVGGDADGLRVGTIITIYLLERLKPEPVVERLLRWPEVIGCYRVSGNADLIATVAEVSRERLEAICDAIWHMSEIRSTETVMVLKRYVDPAV